MPPTRSEGPRALFRRLNAGVFDLPARDLVVINRWLSFTRCFSAGAVFAFFLAARLAGYWTGLLGWIGAICLIEVAITGPYLLWLRTGRALGLLIYTQFVVDLGLITVAFAGLPDLPLVFDFLFLVLVVPCSLFSLLCGMLIATLASGAHLLIAWLRSEPTGSETLAPIFLFFLIAYQSRFYGQRLAEKSREAETEATVAAALLRVAGELATAVTGTAVLERLTDLARELTAADWASVMLRDPARGTYRVVALAPADDAEGREEVLSVEFPPGDFPDAVAARAATGVARVRSPEESPAPRWLHVRWRFAGFLAVVLRRGEEPLALLLVGHRDRDRDFPPPADRLLVGMAHQAVLALENARLLDDLRAASAQKSEFIGTMSHELRSPLHAIIGYTGILAEEEDNPGEPSIGSRRQLLERIHVHSLQLLEMIQATLDVSRLEAGRLPVQLAPVALDALFAEIRDGIPAFLRRGDVALEWHLPRTLPTAETDAAKLKMIVRNLVHNALKFTDEGRVAVRVTLDLDGARPPANATWPAVLTIVVDDTGIGIAEALRGTVFDMFRQADGAATRPHGGVGLGLHIVKRLVQALGGSITLDSTVGRGSRFRVIVPVQVVDALPAAVNA